MSPSELELRFENLRSGARAEPTPSLKHRIDRLQRLRALLIEKEASFISALSSDYGYRAAGQSQFADFTTTIKAVNHNLQNLKYWMAPKKRRVDLSLRLSLAKAEVQHVPKGVVGIISPWNFPINLSFSPLASVLAAGNRALIKPSEATPATAELMERAVSEYFDGSEVAVITGEADVASTMVDLPLDHLIYTGSERVAQLIAAASAKNLTPLTLELGGKSPVIADRDANIPYLAKKLVFGKHFNAGQICIAPDYCLIQTDQLDALLAALPKALDQTANEGSGDDSVRIVNERHQKHIQWLIEDAADHSAFIKTIQPSNNPNFQLHIVVDPDPGAAILKQEIFGPVLLIRTTNSFQHQQAIIREGGHPLVIYYFGNRKDRFQQCIDQAPSGAAVWNDIIFQYANDDLPFGGVGSSGYGRYRGRAGFEEFSNPKSVYHAGMVDTSDLVSPPFGKAFQLTNRIMRKLWLN